VQVDAASSTATFQLLLNWHIFPDIIPG